MERISDKKATDMVRRLAVLMGKRLALDSSEPGDGRRYSVYLASGGGGEPGVDPLACCGADLFHALGARELYEKCWTAIRVLDATLAPEVRDERWAKIHRDSKQAA